MKTHQNLIGNTFNRLTVESEAGRNQKRRDYLWLCKCSCGGSKIVSGSFLKSGKIKSCGCLNRESRVARALENAAARKGKITRDLTGKKIGRLTAKSHFFKVGRVFWNCDCECGKSVAVRSCVLTNGKTKSCGCIKNEMKSQECRIRNTTHGMSDAPEYSNWKSMMARCFNPRDAGYEEYGGAGRTVCEFIRASPLNMVLLMGRKPSPLHSIDRIDNDIGYYCGACAECLSKGWPLNVRWATRKEQLRNRSNNVLFCIDGVTHCASEWAENLGLTRNQFTYRYREHKVTHA